MQTPSLSYKETYEAVLYCLSKGRTALIWGSPGQGKSAIGVELANYANYELIDIRLANHEPADIGGYPYPNDDKTKATFLSPDLFPLEGDPLPEGKDGWLILLDELLHAHKATQNAAYKLIFDRMVGKHKLHPNIHIVCCTNKITDGANVEAMSTALASKVVHFVMDATLEEFKPWYIHTKKGDDRVLGFLDFRPEYFYLFDPSNVEYTFPCPRTWEFVSDFIKGEEVISEVARNCIVGAIGGGPAAEFLAYCSLHEDLITVPEILKAPESIAKPTEASTLYALSGSLGSQLNKDNGEELMKFITRLPEEYQVLIVKNAVIRNPSLFGECPAISTWAVSMGRLLIDTKS